MLLEARDKQGCRHGGGEGLEEGSGGRTGQGQRCGASHAPGRPWHLIQFRSRLLPQPRNAGHVKGDRNLSSSQKWPPGRLFFRKATAAEIKQGPWCDRDKPATWGSDQADSLPAISSITGHHLQGCCSFTRTLGPGHSRGPRTTPLPPLRPSMLPPPWFSEHFLLSVESEGCAGQGL